MTTWYCVRSNELKHHGIKGQKWGVRRFQNKDGSLTPAGVQRYDKDGNKKQTRKDKLAAKYRSEGLSAENAEYLAARRVKTERIVAAAAAITVTAATAYVVNKNLKGKIDKAIKPGISIQRISEKVDQPLLDKKALYVSFDKNDNSKYMGMYGQTKALQGDKRLNKITYNATSKIKIPSRHKSEEVFKDLYKNDPEFKKAFKNSLEYMKKENWLPEELRKPVNDFLNSGKSGLKDSKFSDVTEHLQNKKFNELSEKLYDAFNFGLVNTRGDGKVSGTKFYNKLKELGYDAITDINDQKYSGYKSKNPTIVFNTAKLAIDKVEELKLSTISKEYTHSQQILRDQANTERLIKTLQEGIKSGSVPLGIAATLGVSSVGAQTVMITKYRKEHPNTKLTDKEIMKMLYEKK